jgi:hypothetical protein
MADSFLDSLGAAEAQRRARVAPEDALWEAIAQGRASAEQCDAARIEEPERFAAFSPLDAAAREAVHARVAAALARGAADADGAEDNVVALAPRRAQVRWQRVAMFAAPLLAAAALVLMLRPRRAAAAGGGDGIRPRGFGRPGERARGRGAGGGGSVRGRLGA